MNQIEHELLHACAARSLREGGSASEKDGENADRFHNRQTTLQMISHLSQRGCAHAPGPLGTAVGAPASASRKYDLMPRKDTQLSPCLH
jgi:hypothetical protein